MPVSSKRTLKWKLLLLALLGIIGIFFSILFILANNHWTPVYIPSVPWHQDPVSAAFEAKLSAVVVVSFVLGALFTIIFWRISIKQFQAQSKIHRQNMAQIENELKKTERLVASSREER